MTSFYKDDNIIAEKDCKQNKDGIYIYIKAYSFKTNVVIERLINLKKMDL